MLTAINTILEMAATLICVNYLFGKRYYFSIYDAVFMVVEVTLIESANYFGLSKGMALFGYVGIYIYELLKSLLECFHKLYVRFRRLYWKDICQLIYWLLV